jgi:hypothetical protein
LASVDVTGNVDLTATGAYSQSTLSVQSQRNPVDQTLYGLVRFGGGLTMIAAGDKSGSSTAIIGDQYTLFIGGSTRMEAAGVDSRVAMVVFGTPSRALSMVSDRDLLVQASGALSQSSFRFTSEAEGGFVVNGKLAVKASAEA